MQALYRFFASPFRLFCLLLALLACLLGCEAQSTLDEDDGDIPVGGSVSTGKRVALTFDDGPHNVHTKAIVDELSKYGYHATFFVVGNRVDGTDYNGASALRYAAEAGNEIAIHGYTHKEYYDECSDEAYEKEISKTENAIKMILPNAEINLMRPVGGMISSERVQTSPYSIILWNVDSEDWKNKYQDPTADAEAAEKVETIVENVMENVSDGDIILLHDIYRSTYDATVIILERLHEAGYEVVTVSELLGESRLAGCRYRSAYGG